MGAAEQLTATRSTSVSASDDVGHLAPVWAHLTRAVIERAEGCYLFDVEGHRYLDFTSGIGVTNTGHCHPTVVAAAREQIGRLIHGQINVVFHRPMLDLVDRLLQVVPSPLDSFFFANSGAEAVEAALKLARQRRNRGAVILPRRRIDGVNSSCATGS